MESINFLPAIICVEHRLASWQKRSAHQGISCASIGLKEALLSNPHWPLMSFRGELLQFQDDAFRMISSDAKLEINSPPHPPKSFKAEEVSYRACVPRVLISEYANQKILEIFLLENTRMQRTTLSLLWVQTRENYQKCYVFHFWSRIDFQEFSRLSDATQSMQSVQVLKKTILFEMGWVCLSWVICMNESLSVIYTVMIRKHTKNKVVV